MAPSVNNVPLQAHTEFVILSVCFEHCTVVPAPEGERERTDNKSFFYHTLILYLKTRAIIKTDIKGNLRLVKLTSLTSCPDRKHMICSITSNEPKLKMTKVFNDSVLLHQDRLSHDADTASELFINSCGHELHIAL